MELLSFGKTGWGDELIFATIMTLAVSVTAMLIGFIFASSTIWNVNMQFLQTFSWLIGAFVVFVTYYLLASGNE